MNQAILHHEVQMLCWWVSTAVPPNDQPEPINNEEPELRVVPWWNCGDQGLVSEGAHPNMEKHQIYLWTHFQEGNVLMSRSGININMTSFVFSGWDIRFVFHLILMIPLQIRYTFSPFYRWINYCCNHTKERVTVKSQWHITIALISRSGTCRLAVVQLI